MKCEMKDIWTGSLFFVYEHGILLFLSKSLDEAKPVVVVDGAVFECCVIIFQLAPVSREVVAFPDVFPVQTFLGRSIRFLFNIAA